MKKNHWFLIVLLILSVFTISFYFFSLVPGVSAANCWQYTSPSNGCTSANGCNFRNDSWSSSTWCEELSCWSLSNQSSCSSISISGKNCTWEAGQTNYYCSQSSCWSFSGTNQTACESNSKSLSCTWSGQCNGNGGANCWQQTTQSNCLNATGCSWGSCMDKGCWSYTSSSTCAAGKDSWSGRNCTWSASSSYCSTPSCWNYYNQTNTN